MNPPPQAVVVSPNTHVHRCRDCGCITAVVTDNTPDGSEEAMAIFAAEPVKLRERLEQLAPRLAAYESIRELLCLPESAEPEQVIQAVNDHCTF